MEQGGSALKLWSSSTMGRDLADLWNGKCARLLYPVHQRHDVKFPSCTQTHTVTSWQFKILVCQSVSKSSCRRAHVEEAVKPIRVWRTALLRSVYTHCALSVQGHIAMQQLLMSTSWNACSYAGTTSDCDLWTRPRYDAAIADGHFWNAAILSGFWYVNVDWWCDCWNTRWFLTAVAQKLHSLISLVKSIA